MKNILGGYLTPHPPIILEEIGRGEEKKAQDTIEAMKTIAKDIRSKSPGTIVLITPHGPVFSDAVAISGEKNLKGSFKDFGFENLKYEFKNNTSLVEKILEKCSQEDLVTVKIDEDVSKIYNVDYELDHGALVPLDFINKEYKDFKLVHITYGLLPAKELYRFGQIIKESIIELDEKAIVIASGDLSHKLLEDGPYDYSPKGKEFDEKIMDIIQKNNLKDLVTFDEKLAEEAGECGLRSLIVMAGALDKLKTETEVLSYQGTFGVGYGTAIIDLAEKDDKGLEDEEDTSSIEKIRRDESEYVKLARKSLEHFVRTGNYLDIEEESPSKKGVFVTLKKDGELRGCIGTTESTTNSLEREIIQNAVSAGTQDPRFPKVEKEELDDLVYSVDILFEPEEIESIDDLDVEKYGVIVSNAKQRGLLLPNLEGVDTVYDQVKIALNKAGIRQDEYFAIERFKVERYF